MPTVFFSSKVKKRHWAHACCTLADASITKNQMRTSMKSRTLWPCRLCRRRVWAMSQYCANAWNERTGNPKLHHTACPVHWDTKGFLMNRHEQTIKRSSVASRQTTLFELPRHSTLRNQHLLLSDRLSPGSPRSDVQLRTFQQITAASRASKAGHCGCAI